MQFLIGLILAVGLQVLPQDVPRPKQGTYAITNARIETVTNGTIENGTIIIQADRIQAVGANVQIPEGAEVIDAGGRSLYPGMIDSGTTLGLNEVGAVAQTNDSNELGQITPQMDALVAINPNSVAIPVTRVSGVTTVLAEPSGGVLPGMAAVINLVGYTPDQMYAGSRLMVVSWPSGGRRGRWDSRSAEAIAKAEKESMKRLNEVFDRAELYARIDSTTRAGGADRTPVRSLEMDAMLPVMSGDMTVMIRVNREKDIRAAIKWVAERGLDNVVFSGVSQGWRVADELAAAGIPCLVGPALSIPGQSDRYDKAYANAGLLADAGVKVSLRSGEMENVRNLAFNAGFAAAYGLGREEALRAVTINAAEAFGIADDYGSIEVGKKANFLLSNGDPFEPSTEITEVFIDGFRVPIDSRHIQLYKEFLNRDQGRLQPVEIVPPVRN